MLKLCQTLIEEISASKREKFEKMVQAECLRREGIMTEKDKLMSQIEKVSNATIIQRFEEKREKLEDSILIVNRHNISFNVKRNQQYY